MGASSQPSQGATVFWHREHSGLRGSAAACAHVQRAGECALHRHQLPPLNVSGLRSLDSATLSAYAPGPIGTKVKLTPVQKRWSDGFPQPLYLGSSRT